MVMLSALLSIGLVSVPAELDGEGAVEAAKRFVRANTSSKELVLQALVPTDGKGYHFDERAKWTVGLSNERNRSFSATMTGTGKVLYFSANSISRKGAPSVETAKPRSVVEPWVRRWQRSYPDIKPYRWGSIGVGQGRAAIDLDLLVEGRPVFNLNPHYGYHLVFDSWSGDLCWFGKRDRFLPPRIRTPKVTAEAARAVLSGYTSSAPTTDGIARLLINKQFPGTRSLDAELGYYKPANEEALKLVYQGVVWSKFGNNPPTRSGSLNKLVDATTGVLITPDDGRIN